MPLEMSARGLAAILDVPPNLQQVHDLSKAEAEEGYFRAVGAREGA